MILSALGVSATKILPLRRGIIARERLLLVVHRSTVPARSDFSLDIVFH
jgi:hypothetical protein